MSRIFKSTNNTHFLRSDSHKYIRSDVPCALTKEDISWLIENGVTTAVDLRTADEISNKPCSLAQNPNFTYINIPITGGNALPESPKAVVQSYINMIDNTFWKIIDVIENCNGNVIYFCNAGKDRTGVVSAVLLSRMGADRAEIVSDYMQSKENLKEILAEFAEKNKDVDINVITPKEENIIGVLEHLNS